MRPYKTHFDTSPYKSELGRLRIFNKSMPNPETKYDVISPRREFVFISCLTRRMPYAITHSFHPGNPLPSARKGSHPAADSFRRTGGKEGVRGSEGCKRLTTCVSYTNRKINFAESLHISHIANYLCCVVLKSLPL